jgi:hypothetical protein
MNNFAKVHPMTKHIPRYLAAALVFACFACFAAPMGLLSVARIGFGAALSAEIATN